jgi:hypothetical protein
LPNVDTLSGLGKGGQIGRDHHGGGILEPRRDAGRQLHAQPARNPAHRLRQVFQVVVARSGQAHHDAIAGQLVRSHALELAQIAHALGMGGLRQHRQRGHGSRQQQQDRAGAGQQAAAPQRAQGQPGKRGTGDFGKMDHCGLI